MRLIEKLDRMPPFLCRLMARRNGRSPSNKELSAESGIPLTTLRRICEKKSWEDVPVGIVTGKHNQVFLLIALCLEI